MISVEDISFIPDMELTEYSRLEFENEQAKDMLVKRSKEIKLVLKDGEPVMLVGLYRPALLSIPFLWTLLTPRVAALKLSEFKTLARILREYKLVKETLIQDGNVAAQRLAYFFGFAPTEHFYSTDDRVMRLWRN